MKCLFSLAAIMLLTLPSVATAQTPDQIAKTRKDAWVLIQDLDKLAGVKATPCGCKAATLTADEQADIAEAVARGFGSRIAIGPFRECTLAVKAWRAGNAPTDPNDLTTRLGRTPRFTACQKATMAVIALEMTNSFSPGTIPPQVLALAIQMQQAACNQPMPPTPVPTKAPTLAPPAMAPNAPTVSNWLSPQFILDGCAGSNGGCGGDDNTTVLAAAKNMGIPLESDYGPYQGYSQGCHTMSGSGVKLYTVSDWGYADPNSTGVGDTNLIKAAILKYNGVGCAVAADAAFENYSGGVFSGRYSQVNHDVFIAGWDDSKGAWLMVNSWGPGWGIDPTTGKAVARKFTAIHGLKLPPLHIRQAKHAVYRAHNMKAVADLVKAAETLPAAYSCIATQAPIADQGQCGSCWDFSGCRVVAGANILAGTLPKSTWTGGGCMWIKYGSNEIGTEPVYAIGGTPVAYVAPPVPGPSPDTPTHRASVILEKGARLNKTNPALIQKALKAAEDVLQTAP